MSISRFIIEYIILLFIHYIYTVSRPCPYDGDFKCNDTGVCLRSTDVCNGYSECQYRYGSDSDYDEQNCGM